MSVRRHLGFGSTPSFQNLYKDVQKNTDTEGRLAYAKYDPSLGEPPTEEQIELLQNYEADMPTLTFKGCEKLHGENMAVCYSQGEMWVQGRNHVRTLLGDQNGMAAFVDSTKSTWMQIFNLLEGKDEINTTTHTIVLDCEWAGGNIQKGNAACSGTDKGAYLFDYYRVVNNEDDEDQTLFPTTGIGYIPHSIYNMAAFGNFTVTLDFNKPEECENTLKKIAELAEDNSPIAEYFEKPNNVGEGVYLYCLAANGYPTYRLKAKGEKHGGKPKVKREQKPMDSELEAKLSALAEEVTPTWRLTQAITETNATEMKHIGEVMKWVNQDIVKEEMPKLEAAEVDPKQLGHFVAAIVKTYYIGYLKQYNYK